MRAAIVALGLLGWAQALYGQSVLERSPNLQGVWTLPAGNASFVFAHRFEFLDGGDELLNVPTLSLALGLPLGLTAGLDYSSNSEIPGRQGGNETQLWLKRALALGARTSVAALAAYNTAAESVDGAIGARQDLGRISLFGEGRFFSDLLGTGEGGMAGAIGAAVRLTEYLALTGDVGRVLTEDSLPAAWSAAAAIAIPGTPHTFSLQATNSGSLTLHGASRERPGVLSGVRYGFVFTVPLGTGSQWARIFRPATAAPTAPPGGTDGAAARVEMRQIEFAPREVRIRAGQSVEWINRDPVAHTATADDRGWGSDLLGEGQSYVRRFDRPGRYRYHCVPHPMMTGLVIVEGP